MQTLYLPTDANYVANLVNVTMWLETCNSAVYYMCMLQMHNDIFLTDIIGSDRLKFTYISREWQTT